MLLQEFFTADDGCRRTVSNRGAHSPGQGECHLTVLHDLIDGLRKGVLRQWIQGRVVVGFGGNGSQLPLGSAVFFHVTAGTVGIKIHEHGMAFLVTFLFNICPRCACLAGLLFSAFFLGCLPGLDPFHGLLDIGSGNETLKRFFFVLFGLCFEIHFFGADSQCTVIDTGLDRHPGRVQGRASAGAGILHIHHGDLVQAIGSQCHLSPNGMLKRGHAPAGVGKPGRLDILLFESTVFQHQLESLAGQLLHPQFQVLTELDHAHTVHIYIVTHVFSPSLETDGQ